MYSLLKGLAKNTYWELGRCLVYIVGYSGTSTGYYFRYRVPLTACSVSLWPLNRPSLGAHRRVLACSFPTSASISPGAFSTCFHPVPADDLVVREYSGVVFAFSVGCSLSFCRNFLPSVAPLFPAVVSDGPILSCPVQALSEGPGPHFLGPVYWWPCTLLVPFGGPHFESWPALAASTFCLSQCLLWHTTPAQHTSLLDGQLLCIFFSPTRNMCPRCFRLLL